MKRRVPDPFQLFDHLGNPEDGPERFIEVECDPSYISPELERQLARRREERAAKDELQRYTERPPHNHKVQNCPRCGIRYWEIGMSNGQCAVCIVELRHCDSFQVQLEDIHP